MSMRAAVKFSDVPDFQIICDAVGELRSYIPSQGPIDNFIHHNTFHEFEHDAFESSVENIGQLLGGEPYLTHDEFREAIQRGRITEADMDAELNLRFSSGDCGSSDENATWKKKVIKAALYIPERKDSAQTIRWWLQEGEGLRRFDAAVQPHVKNDLLTRSGAKKEYVALKSLWDAIERRVNMTKDFVPASRAVSSGTPEDRNLGDVSIRIISAYLDRGTARWQMPERERGLWYCAFQLARTGNSLVPEDVDHFKESDRLKNLSQLDGLSSCAALLSQLSLDRKQWIEIIRGELLALPGWAGMIATLDERGELPDTMRSYPALVDYIALRLLFRREGPSDSKRVVEIVSSRASFAAQIFLVSQILGFTGAEIASMSDECWMSFCTVLNETSDVMRRRILHSAYERGYRNQIFAALRQNARQSEHQPRSRPKFQALFCLDEREESFRRHLEDCEPLCETFGAAGFFGIDMLYHPHDSRHPEPYCPAAITPKHIVKERLSEARFARYDLIPQFKKILKFARTRFLGAPLLPSAALVDASRLFFNVHFPLGSMRVGHSFHFRKSLKTSFEMMRDGDVDEGQILFSGYSIKEMVERVETIFRMIGLVDHFSPLVLLIGHGSTTTNNHFQSAYDCGACGGRRGQYNGRVFAAMANDPQVRIGLKRRGIEIPSDTFFVGGIHDTCSETVVLFDRDGDVSEHADRIAEARAAIEAARGRNARERYRRFGDTRNVSEEQALIKVEMRAHHAAEVRPEYGHGSNAASFVGRRSTTRGLFLDRRCFLTSYDCAQDASGEILNKILSAIMPVCGGISLEYYFSRVDNVRFGCGSKLPHNVASMIGVVDGPGSDLRSGLPWQTVEIHEPMRLITIIEGEVEFVGRVLSEVPAILEHFDKGWGQLAILSPSTNEIFRRVNGRFEKEASLPSAAHATTSRSYYDGSKDHLPPAVITSMNALERAHAS